MGGSRGVDRGPEPPDNKKKDIEFLSYTGSDPMKNNSHQANSYFRAIIGMYAKRHLNGHLNGVLLAG